MTAYFYFSRILKNNIENLFLSFVFWLEIFVVLIMLYMAIN